jgi:DNA replication protein DnaC
MGIMTIEMLKGYLDGETKPNQFRIRNLDQETVAKMLTLCYKHEVGKRRKDYIDDPVLLKNIEKVAKWLTGEYKFGLMVYGGVGNGKTTLLRSINSLISAINIEDYWSRKITIRNATAIDIFNIARSNDMERYERFKDSDFLFIDDLGVEPTTAKVWGNEISPITDILYYRYDHQLFTVVTSNLSDNDLKERYGVRIADRMNEMFECIHFSGESYRK